MPTMTEVYEALETTLSPLSVVDQTSIGDYLPPVETENVALVIPPLGMASVYVPADYRGSSVRQSHRIRPEFWIKDQGDITDTFAKARPIANDAVALLWADPTLGGVVENLQFVEAGSFDRTIRSDVSDVLVEVGNAMFLPVTLIVPVYITELS